MIQSFGTQAKISRNMTAVMTAAVHVIFATGCIGMVVEASTGAEDDDGVTALECRKIVTCKGLAEGSDGRDTLKPPPLVLRVGRRGWLERSPQP